MSVNRRIAAPTAAAVMAFTLVLSAQDGSPAPTSPSKAKELVALLQEKKLTAFAAPESGPRFVAVLHIPGVQLLVTAASYGRPMDFEYYLFHKQFQEMYAELKSSPLSADKFFVEDALADGLVAVPAKGAAPDSASVGAERRTFDGDFADPKRKNQKKITQEDYFKAFAAADTRYAALLDVLVAALKK